MALTVQGAWYQAGTKEENTQGMINVIRHPKIHIISHPGDGSAELDFERLVLAAKDAHTLLEINNHSHDGYSFLQGLCCDMLYRC